MPNNFLNFHRKSKGKRMVIDLPLFAESDIAIVKLMSHLNFYDRVQPACLPDPFHIHDGDSIAVASGWGTTNPSTVVFQFKQVQFKQDFQLFKARFLLYPK